MSDIFRRIRYLFEFELDVSFPFPSAEILSLTIAIITVMSMTMQKSSFGFAVIPIEPWSTNELNRVITLVMNADLNLVSLPLLRIILVLAGLIPLLAAFRLAEPIEDGLMKVTLSYPIRRRSLLITKAVQILLLLCVPVTICTCLVITFFSIASLSFGTILVLVSFWVLLFTILSTSFLLSIVSRSSAKTSISGIALWITLLFVAQLELLPLPIRGILNPVNHTTSFFAGISWFGLSVPELSYSDVILSIIGSFVLGLILFLLSIRLFEKIEL